MLRFQCIFLMGLVSFNISASAAANKGPGDQIVQSEITRKEMFDVLADNIMPQNSSPASTTTKLPNGSNLLEWNSGRDIVAATYGSADLKDEPGVYRLTELAVKSSELSATTTTFFKNGLRSKTECSGKTSRTLQCATASRNLCEGFKVNIKKYGSKLGFATMPGNEVGSSVKQQIKNLGEQCADYALFLDNTLDPNKLMTGTARANRDSAIVESDLKAIDDVRKAAKSAALRSVKFMGLDDYTGKGNDVGASSTGMRERSERLKDIGADFKVLSKLAYNCSDATFIEERPGANESVSKEPHEKGETRP